jgi:hypothetical protein
VASTNQRTGEQLSEADAAASQAAAEKALQEAFGGTWGMVATTVPGLLFLILFTFNHDITVSALSALGLSLLLAAVQLLRKQPLKFAFSGVFGVAFGAFFAMLSGNAKNFYLPGMIYTLGLAIVYVVSNLVRFPLIGMLIGPIVRENLSWRTRNPGRFRAYTKATWAWGIIFSVKSAIYFPLYWWGDVTQLGWVRVALGVPPFLLAVYLTWIFLAKAPPPIDVIAELEEQEKREAAEAAETAARQSDPA